MGRIQSTVGLITGTDIVGTVDQLIAISAQPRDRLVSRTNLLQQQQGSIAELTALVIGVQLAGNKFATASAFRAKQTESSNPQALSAAAGTGTSAAEYLVRTLQTASTHSIRSRQRFDAADEAVGYEGTIAIKPAGGSLDQSASLADLNGGRGVETGVIRITDRAGQSAEIDLTAARTIDDVLQAINDSVIDVRATTTGNAITLTDNSGQTDSNLVVEQLGSAETAADLGLWGIDVAADSATGIELELPAGTTALRGVALDELGGGGGLGNLTTLQIVLSDGSNAAIDLSSATTTDEVLDALNRSGLDLIATLNDSKTGFRLRDVSGGSGSFTGDSVDGTAGALGLDFDTTDDIHVGGDLNRQTVTVDTPLSALNGGEGVGAGTFTITDSAGKVAVINLATDDLDTVGELIDAINAKDTLVTASLNEDGDGIALVDNAGGASTLEITDTTGTSAAALGIAGTAVDQSFGGQTVSALIGTQADRIEVTAEDTLTSIAEKINAASRYSTASVQLNENGTFSLSIRAARGGAGGQIAVNTSGFDLDLRTESIGQDARIAVSTDGGGEQFYSSSDGVFDVGGAEVGNAVTATTLLREIGGPTDGSFTITDSAGNTGAVNITVDQIGTIGELIDRINELGIGVSASINEAGNGIQVIDSADGEQPLTITDIGSGSAALSLKIAGEATEKEINGQTVSAIVGSSTTSNFGSGLVLTLKELSDAPISVRVTDDSSSVVSSAQSLVNQYNLLIDKLDSLTAFNPDTNEVGLLFGTNEALRVRAGFARILSGRITSAGNFTSVGQVGLRLNEAGKLELDQDKLQEALRENPADVENFFTTDGTGLADRLSEVADRLAGESSSLLLGRTESLGAQVQTNNDRIEAMNLRLDRERERLLAQFFAMEEAIAKIQSNLSAIDSIQPITIPT